MDYREAVNRARQWYTICHNTNPTRLEPEDVLALEYLQAKLPTSTIFIAQLLENDAVIAHITDLKLSAGGNGCHGCYWDIDEHKQQGDDPCLICTNYVYYENSQT